MAAGLCDYDVNAKFVCVYLFSTKGQYYNVIVASLTGCAVDATGFTCECDSEYLPVVTGICDTSHSAPTDRHAVSTVASATTTSHDQPLLVFRLPPWLQLRDQYVDLTLDHYNTHHR